MTSPCRTSTSTPAPFDPSNPLFDRAAYGVAIYPGSALNDPKGVGFGMNYANTPLGVSIYKKRRRGKQDY
jgi:hypothetical protein